MLKKYVIIVAAGSGSRLESEVPKQFMELAAKPLIVHSLEKFFNYDKNINIYLVLPQQYIDFWKDLAAKFKVNIPHTVVAGGAERFFSVKAALNEIEEDNGLVAVHDAARPMLTKDLIKRSFDTALEYGSALPAIPVKDSLRKYNNGKWEMVSRKEFKAVQTPQVFRLDVLKKAYHIAYNECFTDDASVFEAAGNTIEIIDGEDRNIKITTAADMAFCSFLIEA